jgi:hypothetical protein
MTKERAMKKGAKRRYYLPSETDEETFRRFSALCEKRGYRKSFTVTRVIKEWLEKEETRD